MKDRAEMEAKFVSLVENSLVPAEVINFSHSLIMHVGNLLMSGYLTLVYAEDIHTDIQCDNQEKVLRTETFDNPINPNR